MKTKQLFYLLVISGLLLIANIFFLPLQLIFTDNSWSVVTLVFLFGITGWIGTVWATKVQNDPKDAINQFKPKNK
jgi:hypothetical protein